MTQDQKLDLLLDRTAKIYTHVEVLKTKQDGQEEKMVDRTKRIEFLEADNVNYKVDKGKVIGGGIVAGTFFGALGAGAMELIHHFWK